MAVREVFKRIEREQGEQRSIKDEQAAQDEQRSGWEGGGKKEGRESRESREGRNGMEWKTLDAGRSVEEVERDVRRAAMEVVDAVRRSGSGSGDGHEHGPVIGKLFVR